MLKHQLYKSKVAATLQTCNYATGNSGSSQNQLILNVIDDFKIQSITMFKLQKQNWSIDFQEINVFFFKYSLTAWRPLLKLYQIIGWVWI